jgi:hypothetical protein
MSLLHVGLIAYDYWDAERSQKSFDATEFIRRDLERPWFEQSEFFISCGYYSYTAPASTDIGLNLPAYVAAQLLSSIISGSECDDALMTPRGQIVTSAFVPPLWFLVGLSARRLVERRWRPALTSRWPRAFTSLVLLLVPIAMLLLLAGAVELFLNSSVTGRAWGVAFWMLYACTLVAERLRTWPFRSEAVV